MIKNPLVWFVGAGLLFSGYLSGVKFFSGTCALNESCPYFLGHPACYYGFTMFLTMTILVALAWLKSFSARSMLQGLLLVSTLGILFAGYFTLGELPKLFSSGFGSFLLGLPTCAYGLIVYIAIFFVALKQLRRVDTTAG